MARSRTIKPGFFTNEQLAECSLPARLLFAGLWTVADRNGRMEERPRKIKAQIFPYDAIDVDQLLDELDSNGFLIRYEADGKKCLQIINFRKHQRPHPSEAESGLPPPPKESGKKIAGCAFTSFSPSTVSCNSFYGDCSEHASGSKQTADSSPVVLVFPTVDSLVDDGPKEWQLRQSKLTEYQESFPGIDALGEAKKALQWCRDHPKKRKTVRGMNSFLFRWMTRSQNDNRGLQTVKQQASFNIDDIDLGDR